MDNRGRGQGWEERVQQEVFKQYLEDSDLINNETFFKEVAISIADFKNTATNSRADFIIDRGKYLELVECKSSNHPYNIEIAIGQLLGYRAFLELEKWPDDNIPKRNMINLSLCLVDGYEHGREEYFWTDQHAELIKQLNKSLHEQITVYLVQPKKGKEKKEYWDAKENHEVITLSENYKHRGVKK